MDEDDKPLKHEGWDDIKNKRRGFTDCFFFILLIISWVVTTGIGFVSLGYIPTTYLKPGNYHRLTNALDYNGKLCGYDTGKELKPYAYFLPDQTITCIDVCPTTTDFFSFICTDDVQQQANSQVYYGIFYFISRKCMFKLKSIMLLNRCVPQATPQEIIDEATKAATLAGLPLPSSATAFAKAAGDDGFTYFNSLMSDLMTLRYAIAAFGIGVAAFIGFLYLYLLRIPGILLILIWGVLLSVMGVFIALAVLMYFMSKSWENDGIHSKQEIQMLQAVTYIAYVLAGLYFCFLIVMRSRIQLAIGVIKEAARALATMPILIIMPILQTVALGLFLVPFVIYAAFLATSGDFVTYTGTYTDSFNIEHSYQYKAFVYDDNTKYSFLYLIFSWFWTSEFLIAVGQLITALSFVAWYFNRDKSKISNKTFIWAACTVIFFHLGSAAFGALLVALVRTIKIVLSYIEKKAKNSKNKITEYIMKVLQCCMWCLEKIIKFLNKNAYIHVAIYGDSFCKSARRAFFLLLRNVLRVAAVSMVSSFVLFLGKLFVPAVTVFGFYVYLDYYQNLYQVSGIIGPLIFVSIIAYFISSMFSEVFEMGIETILFCFIADEEMFKPEDRFAESSLSSTIRKTNAGASKQIRVIPTNNDDDADDVNVKSDDKYKSNDPMYEDHKDEGEILL